MSEIKNKIKFISINIAVLTVSDTRSFETDTSGALLEKKLTEFGHTVLYREIVKDDLNQIVKKLKSWIKDDGVDVIITTGGTGVTKRDITPEAFRLVVDKEIPGFGEYFRWVSIKSIGTSTIQSRATAGVADKTYLFSLPGSNGAVKDAWEKILKFQLDVRHKPCNFIELIPRLKDV